MPADGERRRRRRELSVKARVGASGGRLPKQVSRSRLRHRDEAKTLDGCSQGVSQRASLSEVLTAAPTAGRREEQRARLMPTDRGRASESGRCATVRHSCEREELGGGGAVAANCAGASRLPAASRERRKEKTAVATGL
jgi:hypothetical protein